MTLGSDFKRPWLVVGHRLIGVMWIWMLISAMTYAVLMLPPAWTAPLGPGSDIPTLHYHILDIGGLAFDELGDFAFMVNQTAGMAEPMAEPMVEPMVEPMAEPELPAPSMAEPMVEPKAEPAATPAAEPVKGGRYAD